MDQIQVKRDRLLRQAARVYGLAGLIAAFAVLATPASWGQLAFWTAIPFFVMAIVCATMLQSGRTLRWAGGLLACAIAITLVITFVTPEHSGSTGLSLVPLLGAAVPGTLMALLAYRRGWCWYWLGCLAGIGAGAIAISPANRLIVVGVLVLGCVLAHAVGYLLSSSIPPALRQVAEVGRAHRAERQASELEAHRRQNARLLHDTVLATLTLLAHSGRGVSEEALREQARNDAHLLRQLRLGEPLFALPEAGYQPELVEETTLGTTLDSVKQRFDQLGLDVSWHGSARLMLPPGVLDGFLFAISECLENVRRHSGVVLAHVTITEDDRVVRAMVTDAGRGFEVDAVGSERLGIKESVVARLAELGGSARLFSSPGAGTTVLLEVPR